MLVVIGLDQHEMAALCSPHSDVELGAMFARKGGALTGDKGQLERVAEVCKERELFHVFPPMATIPFHSKAFDSQREAVLEQLAFTRDLQHRRSELPWTSSVLGGFVAEDVGPEFWFQNVRGLSRSFEAVSKAMDQGYNVLVELNTRPLYARSFRDELALRGTAGTAVATLAIDDDDRVEHEWTQFLRQVCRLHVAGVQFDFERLYSITRNAMDTAKQSD
mmetsp:Transcript_69028/g.162405  ORF Transcript_69028/g.162405 Transcript_69028/m.162405 type:complete len:220 (-) Transcript_69028:1096-1755(-)